MLTQKEWETVNSEINLIYKQNSVNSLRQNFLQSLKKFIDYSFSDFSMGKTKDGSVYRLTDPVIVSSYDKHFEEEFLEQYERVYESLDYVGWLFNSTESLVYRESDLISDAARKKSPFYRDYLKPFELVHISGMVICSEDRFIGAVSLYNTEKKGDFSDKDIYILQQFLPHVQLQLNTLVSGKIPVDTDWSYYLKNNFSLTNRETQIVGLIYRGLSNRAIARELGITEDTVKKHTYHLFQKLDISGRSQIARFVVEHELTDIF